MKEYKRLTCRNKFGFACYNGVFTENGIQEIINRLAELEDKIENGTIKEVLEGKEDGR